MTVHDQVILIHPAVYKMKHMIHTTLYQVCSIKALKKSRTNPDAVALYYEDQKDAALTRAKDYRENRIPKFFKHFESVLAWNEKDTGKTEEQHLLGKKLTYADLMLYFVVDGVSDVC